MINLKLVKFESRSRPVYDYFFTTDLSYQLVYDVYDNELKIDPCLIFKGMLHSRLTNDYFNKN